MFKKEYNKLYKSYKKRLRVLNRLSFKGLATPVDYFITYLKMIRDCRLLNASDVGAILDQDLELASIITAISEYENSQHCIEKYYNIGSTGISRISNEDEETVSKSYRAEKLFHWESFWNLVKIGVEDWIK
jgi:hypothetical protein